MLAGLAALAALVLLVAPVAAPARADERAETLTGALAEAPATAPAESPTETPAESPTESPTGAPAEAPAPASTDAAASSPLTVVIVTFDGVRPEELFGGGDRAPAPGARVPDRPAAPHLVERIGPSGRWFGRPGEGPAIHLANPIGSSLPGYQSIFAGRPTLCLHNECSPPVGGTLFDTAAESLALPAEALTVFATWGGMCEGLGLRAVADATCGADAIRDRWREAIGGAPGASPPDSVDDATFALGLARLRPPWPAVLFIALDESDGTGHAGDYAGHLATLARYDAWLARLDARLQQMAAAGRASALIVTTDHGRGAGEDWAEHRWNVPGTGDVWLFARGPGLGAGAPPPDTPDVPITVVRPTVERWLGLEPTGRPCHAVPLQALFGGDAADDAAR